MKTPEFLPISPAHNDCGARTDETAATMEAVQRLAAALAEVGRDIKEVRGHIDDLAIQLGATGVSANAVALQRKLSYIAPRPYFVD